MSKYIVIGKQAYKFECDVDCPIAVKDDCCDLWCPMTNHLCDLDNCPASVEDG